MNLTEYTALDGVELARLIRRRELAPSEVLELALTRAKEVNPALNVIVYWMEDQAREQLKWLDLEAPLAGVPTLLKDLLQNYAGTPQSQGSQIFKGGPPDQEHSEFVSRLLKAGMIPFGKTNTPEFGLMGVTEPRAFGVTKNPWNLQFTAGGSSGGSAAAVAAGVVPIAGAGDGGGSIRIPASCCGLIGLKPTRGLLPSYPHGSVWEGAVVEGVLTRSLRDTALALHCLQGPHPSDPYQAQTLNFQELSPPTKRLRVLVVKDHPFQGHRLDPELAQALGQASQALEKEGHFIEYRPLPINAERAAEAYLRLYMGQVAHQLGLLQKSQRAQAEPTTQLLALLGESLSAKDYVDSLKSWNEMTLQIDRLFSEYDLIITPTMATAPLPHGSFAPSTLEEWLISVFLKLRAGRLLHRLKVVDQMAVDALSKLPYTFLFNLTGHPALNIPWSLNTQGLPLGLQLIMPKLKDAELLGAGQLLCDLAPFKRPSILNFS